MKKLLTILAMALALCMLCGFALAADDSYMERDTLDYPSRVHDILNEGKYQIIEIKINTEPTCTTYGTATVKCDNPAHKDYFHLITIEKLPHVFQNVSPEEYNVYDDGSGYAPTAAEVEDDKFRCTNDIYQKQECAVCHEVQWVLISKAYSPDYMHHYVMGKILPGDEGDCMTPRIKTAYCQYCGDIDYGWTEDLGLQDHKFTQKYYDTITVDHFPTCLNNLGYTYVLQCEVCGIYENDQWTPPANQNEWEDGERWVIRTATGMKPADVKTIYGYVVDAAGHTWKNLNKDTVRNNACETLYQNDVCINCAEKRHIPIAGEEGKAANYVYIEDLRIDCQHYFERWQCSECQGKVHDDKLVEVTIEKEEDYWHNEDWTNSYISVSPTCEEEGEWTTTCLDCGKTITGVVPATGHAWTAYTLAIVGDDGFDVYISKCQICNKTRELVRPNTDPVDAADGFKYVGDNDPWCQDPGYHVYYNSYTGEIVHVPFGTPLGHNWIKNDDESIDATCTENGLLAERCLRCNWDQYTVVPATGHSFELVEAKEPTCVDEGNEAYNKCTVCEAIFNEAETEELAEIPVLAATGVHTWDTEKIDMIAGAKCGEHTKMVRYCKYCDATTIEEDGVVPHNPKLVEAVPATCVAEGTAAYYKCDRCDKIFADEAAETELTEAPKTEIDPKNHAAELTLVPEVAATCTKDGVKAYYVCEKCLKAYSDAEGENEIAAPEAIPATGHDFSVLISTTEATCKADGVKVYKCSKCDELKTETLPMLPHELEDVAEVPATCTEAGKEAGKACKNCDYTEGLAEIPALGHDYQNIPAVDPTCTKEGKSESRACTRCGDEQVKASVLPALGHDYVITEAKAATCTEAGWTEGKDCTRCDEEDVASEPIAALGHAWDEGTVTKEAAEGVEGEMTFKCTVCGETKTEVIPALPIPADYKLVDVKFEGTMLTGKIEHVDGTEFAEKLGVRVTFFIEGNVYMTTAATIYEDGTFEAEGAGVIEHVTVAAYATNKVVNPQGLKDVTCFGSTEFDVK